MLTAALVILGMILGGIVGISFCAILVFGFLFDVFGYWK